MSSKPLLLSKMPYSSSSDDLVKNYNFLVKTINSSFITTEDPEIVATPADQVLLNGVFISQSFSGPAGSLFTTFTLNHNMGVTPTGYILSDYEYSSGSVGAESHSISRVSWTNTQITIRLNVTTGTGTAFSGSFKILVLR